MPTLTRRRDPDRSDRWNIYFGDVGIGAIGCCAGVPLHVDQWEWGCGLSAALNRRLSADGTAASFDEARDAFGAAWAKLESLIKPEDYDAHRRQRAFTAWKYAMWERGELMPSQRPNSMMTCPCGERFDSHDPGGSYEHRRHIYASSAC
jgi:hypothetical protein